MKNEFSLKIWLVGDHKVGKSSFIYKFVLNEIPKNLPSTIGITI
jgi:GTPase SAR1 family protein